MSRGSLFVAAGTGSPRRKRGEHTMADQASTGKRPRKLRPETELVHGGTLRSQFGEMSEGLFLTQGYAYDSAEMAERRFTGEDPGFQYSRFSNPTVQMF